MPKIAKQLTELIGNTPLLELASYGKLENLQATLIAKLEYFNPAGSAKDRVALAMVEEAEAQGLLKPGATIIEPTSGNTGIGLAFVAAVRGYKLILTMPDTMSIERRNIVRMLGAEVVLTPGAEGMGGSIRKARELHESIPGSFIPQQFDNPANPAVHRRTTGEEIWQATGGAVDIFVAGVGTGGTVSGVGEALKAHDPQIRIVGAEPAESPVLTQGKSGGHKIQGIGAGFVPGNYNAAIVDEVIAVPGDEAIRTARLLARTEGLLVGISAGAAVWAAAALARRPENRGKRIVVFSVCRSWTFKRRVAARQTRFHFAHFFGLNVKCFGNALRFGSGQRLFVGLHLAQIKEKLALILGCRKFHHTPIAHDVFLNFRSNPVDGKSHQTHAAIGIEVFDRFHESDIAFLDQVGVR